MSKKQKSDSRKWTCVLCGKKIFRYDTDNIVGATGRMVCRNCLDISGKLMQREPHRTPEKPVVKEKAGHILAPKEILLGLDEAIIGQENAKRAVAVALWKQQLRAAGETSIPRLNLMLYGPTGCGKTAIIQEAAKLVGLPFISFDATSLSEAGYRGKDAEDIIKELAARHKGNDKLPYSVVFLDECDKLAAQGGDQRQAYSRGTQHSLLKLVEGAEVNCEHGRLSTAGMLFVFGGAFSRMRTPEHKTVLPIGFDREPETSRQEDRDPLASAFISYGMEPELMGRVGQYVAVEALDAEALKRILLSSKLSVLQQYQAFFRAHHVQLEFSETCLDELAARALSRGMGARGLNTLVEEVVGPWLLKLANGDLKQKKVTICGERDHE